MSKATKRPWTDEEVEQLQQGYKEGTPTQEIALKLNRSWRSVRGKAHQLGLTHTWRDNQLYRAEEDRYIQEYAQKMTRAEIGQELGRSEGSISNRGRRLGIVFADESKNSRYEKNHNYFSKPTLENSYIAGLLAADGWIKPFNVDKPINQVGISLAKQDLHILEYLRDITGYTGVIRHYDVKGYPQAELRICGVRQWVIDLETNWSVTPNKSLTLKPPRENGLTQDQLLAYHVGLMEGDGHIGIANGTLKVEVVTVSDEFASWLKQSWGRIAGAEPSRYLHQNQTAHYIAFYGANARRLCTKLMSVGVHRMNRKWDIARLEIDKHFQYGEYTV